MIGHRLKIARAAAGLSLRDLAVEIDGLVTPKPSASMSVTRICLAPASYWL